MESYKDQLLITMSVHYLILSSTNPYYPTCTGGHIANLMHIIWNFRFSMTNIKAAIFWDVMPCNVADVYHHLEEQVTQKMETLFLETIGNYQTAYCHILEDCSVYITLILPFYLGQISVSKVISWIIVMFSKLHSSNLMMICLYEFVMNSVLLKEFVWHVYIINHLTFSM